MVLKLNPPATELTDVDSLGYIEFFDLEKHSLGFTDIPVSKDPSEKGHTAQYGDAKYYADGKTICIQLPIYRDGKIVIPIVMGNMIAGQDISSVGFG